MKIICDLAESSLSTDLASRRALAYDTAICESDTMMISVKESSLAYLTANNIAANSASKVDLISDVKIQLMLG